MFEFFGRTGSSAVESCGFIPLLRGNILPHCRFMPIRVNPLDCESLEAGLGDRLREQRKALGLTQEAIAQLLNVAVRSVKGYEAGSTTVASDLIFRMMAIGIDICHLFYGKSLETLSILPTRIDPTALDRAVAWVDGEWGNEGEGQRIPDRERLEWILIAYASIADGTFDETEGRTQLLTKKAG